MLDETAQARRRAGRKLLRRRLEGPASVPPLQAAGVDPGVDDRLHEEGVASRALVQEPGDLRWELGSRETGGDVFADRIGGERLQGELGREAAETELLQRLRGMDGPVLTRPERAEQEQTRRVGAAGEQRDEIEGGRIAPVQVLEQENERPADGDRSERLDDLAEHPLGCRTDRAL